MTFKQRCQQLLLGAGLFLILQVILLLVYASSAAHRAEACERAERENYVFDTCINIGDCLWGPEDLLKSADALKFIKDNCPGVKP